MTNWSVGELTSDHAPKEKCPFLSQLQIASQLVVGPWLSLRQDIDITPKGPGNITEEEAERMEEAEDGGKVINAIVWT